MKSTLKRMKSEWEALSEDDRLKIQAKFSGVMKIELPPDIKGVLHLLTILENLKSDPTIIASPTAFALLDAFYEEINNATHKNTLHTVTEGFRKRGESERNAMIGARGGARASELTNWLNEQIAERPEKSAKTIWHAICGKSDILPDLDSDFSFEWVKDGRKWKLRTLQDGKKRGRDIGFTGFEKQVSKYRDTAK